MSRHRLAVLRVADWPQPCRRIKAEMFVNAVFAAPTTGGYGELGRHRADRIGIGGQ